MTSLARILTVMLLLLLNTSATRGKNQQIKPGCRYEGRRYQEGASVITSEPCLQCRCIEGALRCRLRVCPRLPNPPPSGCRVRPPGENVCCAELVCSDTRDSANILRRSNAHIEQEEKHEEDYQTSRFQGCLHEGVRYGPGSAMMGSRRCEYCYCISGARRCIRPKCLLPLPGCTPLYAPHSCCPVAYNCTHLHSSTLAPIMGNGCRVGSRVYEEGEMVRDIEWKAACDNCFCAMGAVRCVPLACAPPLQGCSPIVREGHCCPSTYNCSGSIEVKATQNYASYAFISKDYAKFRKETNFFPIVEQITSPPVEGRGHRVVEERIDSSTTVREESSSIPTDSTSWPSTFETDIMDNEILVETVDYVKSSPEFATTTPASPEESTTSAESTTLESTLASKEDEDPSNDPTTTATTTFSTSGAEGSTITVIEDLSSVADTATESTTLLPEATGNDTVTEDWRRINVTLWNRDTIHSNATSAAFKEEFVHGNATMEPAEATQSIGKGTVNKPSSTVLMPDDILVMNVTVKTNVSVGHIQGVTINPIRSIPPDVEAILNITPKDKGVDYVYDYSEPTLPPSLPNVRIIPFVAADALVKDKTVPSPVTGYPSGSVVVPLELRPTDTSGFYDIATQENRFSPPVETEGGFVPREPPYFDAPYHSTDLNLEIGTGVTVVPAPITNPHRKSDVSNCLFENMEHRHGEILPSSSICVICMCYYGEVVCSSEKCPPLKIGCRRINTDKTCCGRIVCVEADESPTLVLDRADATAPSLHQPIVSPDPFRDVIKTEPAPDLPSLIEDMLPYLVEHGITTPRPSSSSTTLNPLQTQGSNHLQQSFSFDYIDKLTLIRPPYDYRPEETGGGGDRLTGNTKYVVNQDNHLKEPIPAGYPKDSEPDHEKVGVERVEYEKIGSSVAEQSTKLPEDRSKNLTDPNSSLDLVKSNSSKSDDTQAGSKPDDSPSQKGDSKVHPATLKSPEATPLPEEPIFSLDSVLDLLFSSNNEASTESSEAPTAVTSRSAAQSSTTTRPSEDSGGPATETGTSSKILENEIPASVASLLKLAGCNIYGRMYRVGRIITELSGPCLECRCTEIGVQCKQLQC
nr:uncharacterized protein LOC117222330 [Megalopta genalis]